jgi:hypothetical protein
MGCLLLSVASYSESAVSVPKATGDRLQALAEISSGVSSVACGLQPVAYINKISFDKVEIVCTLKWMIISPEAI